MIAPTTINTTTTTKRSTATNVRQMLIAFYEVHNPKRIKDVDRLLEKYRQDVLLECIAKKYKIDPSELGLVPVTQMVNMGHCGGHYQRRSRRDSLTKKLL